MKLQFNKTNQTDPKTNSGQEHTPATINNGVCSTSSIPTDVGFEEDPANQQMGLSKTYQTTNKI